MEALLFVDEVFYALFVLEVFFGTFCVIVCGGFWEQFLDEEEVFESTFCL